MALEGEMVDAAPTAAERRMIMAKYIMCRIKERRSIWQNSLVYALCQAVRLLLIDKIKEERRCR